MKKIEVIVKDFDRIGWLNEKGNKALRHLSAVYDTIEESNIDSKLKEEIRYNLDFSMRYSMETFLCLLGHPNGFQKGEFIDSKDKYIEFLENYELSTPYGMISERNKIKSDNQKYIEIKELLQPGVPRNRTTINQLLDRVYIKDDIYNIIDKLLDDCNLGKISWKNFCRESNKIITDKKISNNSI